MKILISGGRFLNPGDIRSDKIIDILLVDGKIKAVEPKITEKDCLTIDATGKVVVPGLIDMHTHLRQPGYEYKETISSGTRAALRGGFSSVLAMANTSPVADSPDVIRQIIAISNKEGSANVFPVGSVTIGQRGRKLVNVKELVDAGVLALSDDGEPITDQNVMRQALEECRKYNLPIISHCEMKDERYIGWVMNEGYISKKLGVKGIPKEAEEEMVARDIKLAEETGGHVHIAHVSTGGSVELIRKAKKKGIRVSAEVTPHHFSLTEEALIEYGTNAKMNPPLRTEEDVKALIEGLKDGTIDVISTDHAPHSAEEKAKDLKEAPFGVSGLETCLSLVITRLVKSNILSIEQAIEKLTTNPARILGLKKGTLSEGADADITIIDPDIEYEVDVSRFESKGKNTPFAGWILKGLPMMTIVSGNIRFVSELFDAQRVINL